MPRLRDRGVWLIVLEAGEAGAKELGEEVMASHGGGAALTALTAGDFDEGVTDVGQQGKGDRQLLKLGGVLPVLEGVEVASGRASAGSFATPRHFGPPLCSPDEY
jgi:hypothetical protein